MSKKIMAVLMVLAIVLTLIMSVPVSAETSIDGKIFFNADFTTGEVKDLTGNYEYSEDISGCDPIKFDTDAQLNKQVLVIDEENMGSVVFHNKADFSFLGYDLSEGLTFEAYFKISTDPEVEKRNINIAGVGYGYFGFSEYNDFSLNPPDYMSCFMVGDGDSEANFNMGIAADTTKLYPHNEWVHVVGTSSATETKMYVNGQPWGSTYTRTQGKIGERYNSKSADIYIADSIYGSMWGDVHFEGSLAFIRIYRACATDADVTALYEAAKSGEGPAQGPTAAPGEATPTPAPSAPTEEPSKPTDAPSKPTDAPAAPTATPAPTAVPNNNTNTFDIGLVALGGMLCSTLPVIRRKRK